MSRTVTLNSKGLRYPHRRLPDAGHRPSRFTHRVGVGPIHKRLDGTGNDNRESGPARHGHGPAVRPAQRPNRAQIISASQAEGSGTATTCRPSCLGLVDGTGSVVEAGGVQRGTRAPGRSAYPPSWLTVVGWGSCHNRGRFRGQSRSTPAPLGLAPAPFLGQLSRSSAR